MFTINLKYASSEGSSCTLNLKASSQERTRLSTYFRNSVAQHLSVDSSPHEKADQELTSTDE
jgi:hypothetical protein